MNKISVTKYKSYSFRLEFKTNHHLTTNKAGKTIIEKLKINVSSQLAFYYLDKLSKHYLVNL